MGKGKFTHFNHVPLYIFILDCLHPQVQRTTASDHNSRHDPNLFTFDSSHCQWWEASWLSIDIQGLHNSPTSRYSGETSWQKLGPLAANYKVIRASFRQIPSKKMPEYLWWLGLGAACSVVFAGVVVYIYMYRSIVLAIVIILVYTICIWYEI